jgi:hypothetical protein
MGLIGPLRWPTGQSTLSVNVGCEATTGEYV